MPMRRRSFLLSWAGFASAAFAQPAQRQLLSNGLEVLSLPTASAQVCLQLTLRVGARDEPRMGLAQLLAHMMSGRSRHLAEGDFERWVLGAGGSCQSNAGPDNTVFQALLPAQQLEPLLWAEAERLANLSLDAAALDAGRRKLREAWQQTSTDPYRFVETALRHLYAQHPYRGALPGTVDDMQALDAVSPAELQRFHAGFYRPDNARLIVVGGFDPALLARWVEFYFGSLRAPVEAIQRPAPTKLPKLMNSAQNLSVAPRVQPAAMLVWPLPAAAGADAAALQLAQALLANGASARLAESLVRGQQLALSADCHLQLDAEMGLFAVHAVAAGKTSAERLVTALQAELEALVAEPITRAEFDKAKALLATDALARQQTPDGLVAQMSAANPDPTTSAAEVQRALRRLLARGGRAVLLYTPRSGLMT
ncbi:MAG TPA: pitrilysin family protein [Burkholderiaceae bacterium]